MTETAKGNPSIFLHFFFLFLCCWKGKQPLEESASLGPGYTSQRMILWDLCLCTSEILALTNLYGSIPQLYRILPRVVSTPARSGEGTKERWIRECL